MSFNRKVIFQMPTTTPIDGIMYYYFVITNKLYSSFQKHTNQFCLFKKLVLLVYKPFGTTTVYLTLIYRGCISQYLFYK